MSSVSFLKLPLCLKILSKAELKMKGCPKLTFFWIGEVKSCTSVVFKGLDRSQKSMYSVVRRIEKTSWSSPKALMICFTCFSFFKMYCLVSCFEEKLQNDGTLMKAYLVLF